MAYRKKGAKSTSRRAYRRRYSRKRRYRRKFYKRRYRSFPKGTEIKSKSVNVNGSVHPQMTRVGDQDFINFLPGRYITIGGSTDTFNLQIPMGTGQGQRVGAKIEPIKLRISGVVQIENRDEETYAPNFWQVRVIVYQVKGGSSQYQPSNSNYHQMALSGSQGVATCDDARKLFCEYKGNGSFSADEWRENNFLSKVPLRRGIGGLMRVLYKKSFWVNAQKNPIKQFRFITKLPRRFVYAETFNPNEGDGISSICNNAIYVSFWFQPGSFNAGENPDIYYSYHCDLFYSDK